MQRVSPLRSKAVATAAGVVFDGDWGAIFDQARFLLVKFASLYHPDFSRDFHLIVGSFISSVGSCEEGVRVPVAFADCSETELQCHYA